MEASERRKRLLELLQLDIKPVSASNLAEHFQVSRQIIVGDVALLRAAGQEIIATPKGYVLAGHGREDAAGPDTYVIAVAHDKAGLERELYAVIDNGGSILNTSVEHPIYGTIAVDTPIASRYDANGFLKQLMKTGASLLCSLSQGVHMHTVRCPNPEAYRRILMQLKDEGILYTKR